MKRLLYIAILLCTLLCGCHGNNGIFEYLLTEFSNLFIKGHSIEMDGLEGCDTVPLPGDKEQIAASFLANIDTLWVQMRDSLAKHPKVNYHEYIQNENFLYAPRYVYISLIDYIKNPESDEQIKYQRTFLPERPSKFYHAWTDLIVYSKDKLLCWAFVIIRQDLDRGGEIRPPYYSGWNVIGKRNATDKKFKLFVRGRNSYYFDKDNLYTMELMKNEALYVPGMTYDLRDIYPIERERELPILSDPNFFEKHPLFHKYNDSTYNFEWYKTCVDKEKGEFVPERYRYPY